MRDTKGEGTSRATSEGRGEGGGRNTSASHGAHEQLVPIHEDFDELANRVFFSFDEQKQLWARKVRNLRTGSCVMRLVDDPKLYEVDVKRSATGHLAWDMERLHRELPEVIDDLTRLKEDNFRSDLFQAPAVIEVEMQRRLHHVLSLAPPPQERALESSSAPPPNPFE